MSKSNKIIISLISLSCFLLVVAIILLIDNNRLFSSNYGNKWNTLEENLNNKDNDGIIDQDINNSEDKQNSIEKIPSGNESIEINTNDIENSIGVNNNTVASLENNSNNDVSNNKTEDYNSNVNSGFISNDKIDTNDIPNQKAENVSQEPQPTPNENTNNEQKTEVSVISYFENQSNLFSNDINQEDSTLREKAKNVFTSIVDFIFYDKEIKGYTFKELTLATKLKVIQIALSIDSKIDTHFPNYKNTIKDKYISIKGKLAVKYLEVTSNLCEKVGEDTCNSAKEEFNNMKQSFGFNWEFIKELATTGSNKVKDFYESWRDSE